jgi:uncharacterized protein with PIN domain
MELLFLVDSMLGNVAKKLQLLGYDTEYKSDFQDLKLLEQAKKQQRVIISKDHDLIARAKKQEIESVHVTKEDEIEQFLEILKYVSLELDEITGDTARCTKCNSTTSQIDKSNVIDIVPEKVLEYNEKFWQCDNCSQIYWEGTHIIKLQEFLGKLKIGLRADS